MEVDSFAGGGATTTTSSNGAYNFSGDGRPCIVIDAANVVYAAQSLAPDPRTPQPSLRTMIFAVDACKRAGLSTICVLPNGMHHLASNSSSPAEAEAISAWLSESQRTGELLLAPCQNKSDDDIFAIALAVRKDAFLLSNDRFGDHAFAIAGAAGVDVTAVLSWIKERVITYGVAGGEVVPHPIKLAKAMRHIPGSAPFPPNPSTHIVRPYLPPHATPPSQAPPSLGGVNMSITVPTARVGAVIGRGGVTIKAIESSTRARIHISREGESGGGESVIISISAMTEEEGKAAWYAIAAAAAAAPPIERSQRVEQQTISCSTVIDANKLGIFFGRGGTALKALQESTRCKISVEPASDNPTRNILVVGLAEGVAIAVTHIESLQVGSTRAPWGADL